jgi:ATP-dependent RNA helicase DHX37/DHR1
MYPVSVFYSKVTPQDYL